MPEQKNKYLHLIFCQLRLFTFKSHPAAFRIETQPPVLQNLRLSRRTGSFQKRSDPCQKNRHIIGLGNKGIAAQHDAVQFIHIRIPAGNKNDRCGRKGPDAGTDSETVLSRQIDVQQQQMRLPFPDLLQSIRKISHSPHLIAVPL